MNKITLLAGLLTLAVGTSAQELQVKAFRHVGPLPLHTPALLDSTDVQGKTFDETSFLQTPLRLESVREGRTFSDATLPKAANGQAALHLAAFTMTNTTYTRARLNVKGLSHHELYVDGKKVQSGAEAELQPAAHEVVIKALTTAKSTDSLQVEVTPTVAGSISLGSVDKPVKRLYTMSDVLHAKRYSDVTLSPNGRWMIVTTSQTQPGGQSRSQTEVREVATGRTIDQRDGISWMPRANFYYYTRTRNGQREMVTVDPQTRAETVVATDLPSGHFTVSPTEDKLIFSIRDEGPKERPDVYEVIHPDDRQPGWRTRTHLAVYDMKSGLLQPLTFGHSATYLADMSADGRKALVMAGSSQLGMRPTEVSSLARWSSGATDRFARSLWWHRQERARGSDAQHDRHADFHHGHSDAQGQGDDARLQS